MFKPTNRRPRNLQTLLNSEIDSLVSNNDIPTFRKVRDDTGDGAECLRVDDCGFDAEEFGNVGFNLSVDIEGSVETGRTAGTDAIVVEDFNGFCS